MSRTRRILRLARSARLTTYLIALWRLAKDPRTPWAPRALTVFVLAYALSPIDLIPDFIPLLGQLDDLVLIPLGITLIMRWVPDTLWQDCMRTAKEQALTLPRLWWGAALIVALWLALLGLFVWWLVGTLAEGA
ncbi:MAG: YkvA family protein [Ideonella sp.]|nr:YkvA family protein [Ideonella sp.]